MACKADIGLIALARRYNADGTEKRFKELFDENCYRTNEEYEKALFGNVKANRLK
jgi:hypothetical protein